MVDIQSVAAEIRPGKKTKMDRRKKKPQGTNIMACPITYYTKRAAIINKSAVNYKYLRLSYF